MSLGEALNKAASTTAAAGQWTSQHRPGQARGTWTIHHWPNLMARLISKQSVWLTAWDDAGCSSTVPQINGPTWLTRETCSFSVDSLGKDHLSFFINKGKTVSLGRIRERRYIYRKPPFSKCICNLFFLQDGFSLLNRKSEKWQSTRTHMHYSIDATVRWVSSISLPYYGSEIPKVEIKSTLCTKDI